jgi:hypothetical protein
MSEKHRANRGGARSQAQFAQFPFQFVLPQTGVVSCYAENPLFQFAINGRTSWLSFLLVGPLASHSFPMPADHRGWLEQPEAVLQRLARMTRFLFQPHRYDRQRYLLPARNLWSSLLFSLDDPQLLAQLQDLQVFFILRQPADRRHIQHKFPDKQHHTKEHLTLDFQSSCHTEPRKLITLAGFS